MKVSPQTARILAVVTGGLPPGGYRTIASTLPGAGAPLEVARLSPSVCVTAHYLMFGATLLAFPAVVWWRSPAGDWSPMSIDLLSDISITLGHVAAGCPVAEQPRRAREVVHLCEHWLQSIASLHGGLEALEAEVEERRTLVVQVHRP